MNKISVNQELLIAGRGYRSQITTYLPLSLKSKLLINLANLCPVGALSLKLYIFTRRVWDIFVEIDSSVNNTKPLQMFLVEPIFSDFFTYFQFNTTNKLYLLMQPLNPVKLLS